jgi:DNA-binding CsgD family transcriptional regulator
MTDMRSDIYRSATINQVAGKPGTFGAHGGLEREYGGIFTAFFEYSSVSLAILDRSLRVLDANAEFCAFVDRHPAEVFRTALPELVHPQVAERVGRRLTRLVEGREWMVSERFSSLPSSGVPGPVTVLGTAVPRQTRGNAAVLVACLPDRAASPEPAQPSSAEKISEIDAKILQGIAAGVSTADLARQLYLSRQGVEYHIHRMLRNFKAPNRPALVSRAYELGLLTAANWPPRVVR